MWCAAYIKLGQALSIRPDLLSPAAMNEMQKLCDKVGWAEARWAERAWVVNAEGRTAGRQPGCVRCASVQAIASHASVPPLHPTLLCCTGAQL